MEFEDQEQQKEPPLLPNNDSVPHLPDNNYPTNSGYCSDSPSPITATLPSPSSTTTNNNKQQSGETRYRECMKNHAVTIGGYALDGCGEFLSSGPEDSVDAFKCAACNCHRNFHRKEYLVYKYPSCVPPLEHHQPTALAFTQHNSQHRSPTSYHYNRSTAIAAGSGYQHQVPPLALPSTTSGGDGTQNRGGENGEEGGGGGGGGNVYASNNMNVMVVGSAEGRTSSRKRFRTKFTQEQKDKMLELAEQIGWRISKQDDVIVQDFCYRTGIQRQVLKVWMHNNKHTLGKRLNPSS